MRSFPAGLRAGFLILALVIYAMCPDFSYGADTAVEEKINIAASDIFGSVLSPFCPGRLLSDCPSSEAGKLRENIRNKLSQGMTPEQVTEEFYATYGDSYRAAPEPKNFGLVAWLAPVVFFVFGGIFAVLWLRARVTAPDYTAEKELDSKMQSRIEIELKKL